MTDQSAVPAGAGVLELLRLFARDPNLADDYAPAQSELAAQLQPRLKAFEYLQADAARRPGALSGIPVAIKDIIATSDMPTTNGSPIYKDHVPDTDAWVVERLRNLGATIFGKTVSTEFAWRHPGPTVNPWNPNHTPGGSSSGSAASVAAGIVPLALGTQTLGSIVRPAAFNGAVGFKPSFGAIARTGVHPLSPSLDHVGFFARRVDDVALALSLLGGASDSDPHGRPVPGFQVAIEHGLAPIEKPRVAVVRFARWSRVEAEQQNVFEATVATLRRHGAVLEDKEMPELDKANWSAINTILASEAAVIFGDLVSHHPGLASDHLTSLVATGKAHTAYDYLEAKALQERLKLSFAADLEPFDAVLTLPAFGEAPQGLGYTGDAEYCAPWTLLGVPALSLPAGFGKNKLPLGVQIVGRYGDDLRALRVAKWIESTLDFRPGLPVIAI
jgi:amidase